jgi:hypothetical protein
MASPEHPLLQVSKGDDGSLIGRHPSDVPTEILALYFRERKALKAIRAKCLDCCCGNAAEARKCTAVNCALWPLRVGDDPFRRKQRLKPAERAERIQRLTRKVSGLKRKDHPDGDDASECGGWRT